MSVEQLIADTTPLITEILLAITIMAVLFVDLVSSVKESKSRTTIVAITGMTGAFFYTLYSLNPSSVELFGKTLVVDYIAQVFKLAILFGAICCAALSYTTKTLSEFKLGEYYSLLIGATFGACIVASSNNFVMLILGLETMSLCSYVLAGYLKHTRTSAEAALKYLLYGALCSGIMFFGISYLYGLSGTLNISDTVHILTSNNQNLGLMISSIVGAILLLVGLGFKMALVPFHFWCPDTYEGAPTPITAFLSVVSKAGAIAALVRFISPALPAAKDFMQADPTTIGLASGFLGVLAIITMTYGNLTALHQTNAKRMLAYSSIAHAGYLLMVFAVLSEHAVQAAIMYLIIYILMNLTAFWGISVIENQKGNCELTAFRGIGHKAPLLAIVLFIAFIALTGVPPTAGFPAKFILFEAVIGSGLSAMTDGFLSYKAVFFFVLALIGVLNSVVSLFYYMKIPKEMIFETPEDDESITLGSLETTGLLVLGLSLLLLLNFGPVATLVSGGM